MLITDSRLRDDARTSLHEQVGELIIANVDKGSGNARIGTSAKTPRTAG
jgi:hypothetical protein